MRTIPLLMVQIMYIYIELSINFNVLIMGLSDCIFEPSERDEEFVDALFDCRLNGINDNDDWFDQYDLSCRGLANDFFVAECESNNG